MEEAGKKTMPTNHEPANTEPRTLSRKPLRREVPSRTPSTIKRSVSNAEQVLDRKRLVERARALDSLARGRKDAEARSGSVKLS